MPERTEVTHFGFRQGSQGPHRNDQLCCGAHRVVTEASSAVLRCEFYLIKKKLNLREQNNTRLHVRTYYLFPINFIQYHQALPRPRPSSVHIKKTKDDSAAGVARCLTSTHINHHETADHRLRPFWTGCIRFRRSVHSNHGQVSWLHWNLQLRSWHGNGPVIW